MHGRQSSHRLKYYRGRLWTELRHRFPVCDQSGQLEAIGIGPGEGFHEYMTRAVGFWTDVTGEHPDRGGSARLLFRQAIVRGLPAGVKSKLEDVVGLNTKQPAEWDQIVNHYLTEYQQSKAAKKEELSENNLKASRVERGREKKQLLQEPSPPSGENGKAFCYYKPPEGDEYPQYHDYTPYHPPQGNEVPRMQRGGGARGSSKGCFSCGQQGHWKNECPNRPGGRNLRGRGAPFKGPSRGRGQYHYSE